MGLSGACQPSERMEKEILTTRHRSRIVCFRSYILKIDKEAIWEETERAHTKFVTVFVSRVEDRGM